MNFKATRTASAILCTVGAVILVFLLFRFALPALVPLLVSLLLASALRPLAGAVSRKSKMPPKICGGVIICLVFFALIYSTVCLGGKLLHELSSFLSHALSDLESEDNALRQLFAFFDGLPSRIPFLSDLRRGENSAVYDGVYNFLVTGLKEVASKLSSAGAAAATGFIKGLPAFLFGTAVSVIALFYLTVDYDGVKSAVRTMLPKSAQRYASAFAQSFSSAAGGYIRAYLILLLLTFGELLLGFVILGVKYAFLLAAVTAVIDILPVLGVGCVLLPWSLLAFVGGDGKTAVGLLIIFAVMYVVRQFTEPRLMGRFMGIHPLLSLVGAYLGFRFFGLYGMVSAPAVLYLMKSAADSIKGNNG